jgi:hypothetical protein
MLIEERDYYKNLNNKYKIQNEEFKEKILKTQEINQKLNDHIKSLDGKESNLKYKMCAIKKTINEKDKEITLLKNELIAIDSFRKKRNDREEILKNYIDIKEELDKKNKKLREVEKSNTENKLKSDEFYIENQLYKKNNPQAHYIDLINANVKSLKNLRDQNKNLKKELWKYDQNPDFDPDKSLREKSFLINIEKFNVNDNENINVNANVNNNLDINCNNNDNDKENLIINDNNYIENIERKKDLKGKFNNLLNLLFIFY